MSKVLIIGVNHAGTAAANTILDNYPDVEVIVFDRSDTISYLGCGTALWLGRQIKGTEGLFYSSKEKLQDKGATVYMETEVNSIDFDRKTVTAQKKDGTTVCEEYDKLILATGSLPNAPKIPGMDLDGVFHVKLYQDATKLNEVLDEKRISRVGVVGAGYIGVEIAESMRRRGKEVMLFEAAETSLSSYYDKPFSEMMDSALSDLGVQLHYHERISEILGDNCVTAVKTDKGEYPIDLLIMAVGFRPNTKPVDDHIIDRFTNGAFLVNAHQQTSIPGVFAIGDCATVYNNATKEPAYIALATNAVRSGIVAAHNACGTALASPGVQGANGIHIGKLSMVSVGVNLAAAEAAGMDVLYTDFADLQKPAFIEEDNAQVHIRVIYEAKSRRIVGAQMASQYDISMGIHAFSLAIQEGLTIEGLSLLDIFFLPHFNQPYNYITMAALQAK